MLFYCDVKPRARLSLPVDIVTGARLLVKNKKKLVLSVAGGDYSGIVLFPIVRIIT